MSDFVVDLHICVPHKVVTSGMVESVTNTVKKVVDETSKTKYFDIIIEDGGSDLSSMMNKLAAGETTAQSSTEDTIRSLFTNIIGLDDIFGSNAGSSSSTNDVFESFLDKYTFLVRLLKGTLTDEDKKAIDYFKSKITETGNTLNALSNVEFVSIINDSKEPAKQLYVNFPIPIIRSYCGRVMDVAMDMISSYPDEARATFNLGARCVSVFLTY